LSNVDPQFPNSIAAKLVIAKVAQLHSVDSPINRDLGRRISHLASSIDEQVFPALRLVMANLVHGLIIVYKRISCQQSSALRLNLVLRVLSSVAARYNLGSPLSDCGKKPMERGL
jgi:hypothetical protein